MRYGIPYKGSKNKIAEWVVNQLPPAKNFYDLFAGGCAITHCAMLSGKYENFIINDIDPQLPQFFVDCVNGRYRDEKTWVSREMFNLFKDSDPYIRYIWSFGNNGCSYLYSKEKEPIKKAYWEVLQSSSLEECKRNVTKLMHIISNYTSDLKKQIDFISGSEYLSKLNDAKQGVEEVKNYLKSAFKSSGLTRSDVNKALNTQMSSHYFCDSQWSLPTREQYTKLQSLIPELKADYDTLAFKLQSLERLQSLQSLERC